MCGNIYEKGPILAYLDVLYQRSGLDNQHRISSLSSIPSVAQNVQYLTVIANLDYRFHPKWNGYIKIYECLKLWYKLLLQRAV